MANIHYLIIIKISTLFFCFFMTKICYGADNQKIIPLEMIIVQGEFVGPTKQLPDSLSSGTVITGKGLATAGSPATSVYQKLDILPGIAVESTDSYGLGKQNVRVRGVKSMFGGMTVEGIPDYGIMPIGPRDNIFDLENVEEIAVYKGASPADLCSGTGNKGGAVELRFRRPEDEAGIEFKQGAGSDDFRRSFVRMDSGKVAGSRLFISYSHTTADKWKGSGELGPRNHVDFGISQVLGESTTVDTFFSFNDSQPHSFRYLTFDQATDLDDYYRLDYHGSLTGNPAQDVYYYDYNQSDFTNRDIRCIIHSAPTDSLSFSLKPYYANEDGKSSETVSKKTAAGNHYMVLEKIRDLDRGGAVGELAWETDNFILTSGYWYESANLEKYVKKSAITPIGLQSKGYLYYSENDGQGAIHSPYLKLAGEYGRLKWQAGLKYFYYREPASTGYLNDSVSGKLLENPDISLDKLSYDSWLPSLGIGCRFGADLEGYINYGRTYTRPYMFVPLTTLYISNMSRFKDADMTLQDIFDQWKMETSDNVDIGLYFENSWFSLNPVFFYARHHDVMVNAYDSESGLNYFQSDGEARTLGFEMDANLFVGNNLQFFCTPSFTKLTFKENVNRGGATVDIKGRQLPDTPRWLIKTGLRYIWHGFEIIPRLTWIDKRYGDALHREEIGAHCVTDVMITSGRENVLFFKKVLFNLEFRNVFDSEYVGVIDLIDDSGSGQAKYYSGAPFAMIFSLQGKF